MTVKTMSQKIEAVRELAEEVGGSVYEGYSGRGMYGAECFGITCDDPDDVLMACGRHGLPKPKTDNMGRRYIVYWPGIRASAEGSA